MIKFQFITPFIKFVAAVKVPSQDFNMLYQHAKLEPILKYGSIVSFKMHCIKLLAIVRVF